MKMGFYPKLAISGMKKNKRFYFPYFLTCASMIMMFYIIVFLAYCPVILEMKGGSNVAMSLYLGRFVIGVFSVIFLFYTNSFLMRRRKKEFGLYNVLGMDKRNIGKLLCWETLIIGVSSLLLGLAAGIVFSKLAELGLLNMLKEQIDYTFFISTQSIVQTVVLFTFIFILILCKALWQVRLSNPLKLMKEESVGEKAPKSNWFLAVVGALLLGAAYYIAVSITNPLAALVLFFVAVIMVIIATYLLFVSGSVVLCRLLQKNKKYYYKAKHFVSVSSMVYRMKRNGAGLASICILSTMVLVMLSSTTSLYVGAEDSIRSRYPSDICVEVTTKSLDKFSMDDMDQYRELVNGILEQNEVVKKNVVDYRTATLTGMLEGDHILVDEESTSRFGMTTYENVYSICIVPLEDYNRQMGTNETLQQDEAFIYSKRVDYDGATIQIADAKSLKVKKVLDKFVDNTDANMQVIPTLVVIVSEFDSYIQPIFPLADSDYEYITRLGWVYGFDSEASDELMVKMNTDIRAAIRELSMDETNGIYGFSVECMAENRSDFFLTYGGLFFLGIMLSIVFVSAAILMIYYKQISEGYEDESRFEIMQKVGMTKRDIRKSINSQILTVFFAPLLFAGLHQAFAFPLIWKILQLFNLNNLTLLIGVTIACYLMFALCYCMIYRKTSNAYYSIVSGAKEV